MPDAPAIETPWLTPREAADYLKRSYHFVLHEMNVGRLRHARVGGHGQKLTRREWLDEWVTDHTRPIELPRRRFS